MKFIPFHFPGIPQVSCAFGTKAFGNIALDIKEPENKCQERRATIPAILHVDSFAEVQQEHGVRTVFDPDPQNPFEFPKEKADGLSTSQAGIALMVKAADCQTILFAHCSGQYIAAIHCGWRGNRQDYPFIAASEFCEHYRLNPKEVWAVRGPSLGPVAAEFINFDTEWGTDFLPWFNKERRTMDLWQLARNQLSRAGLLPGHILSLDLCTYENREYFYSFRHISSSIGVEDGRQGTFIWIKK